MHILLTRPLEDCSEMILKFQSLGNQVSHLPLLKVNKVNYDEVDLSIFKSIIFTSANAVKFLDVRTIDKKILCFCVGNATEKKSKKHWFSKCNSCRRKCSKFKGVNFTKF